MNETAWTLTQLDTIDRTSELEILVRHADGRPGTWTPIWVVVAEDQVFVRTWHRRVTGWYGRALHSGKARVRVPGLEIDVRVERAAGPVTAIDVAYLAKYSAGGARSMTTGEARASTLQLTPVHADGQSPTSVHPT